MLRNFDTTAHPAVHRLSRWREQLIDCFFEVDVEFSDPAKFAGALAGFDFGPLSLTVMATDALRYHRGVDHLKKDNEEYFLVSFPALTPLRFSQCGRTAFCAPGSFTLERSGEPYDFYNEEPIQLRVLRIPSRIMNRAVKTPERLCARRFDASQGAGALLAEYVGLLARYAESLDVRGANLVGSQIVELLPLAFECDKDSTGSFETAIQRTHLARIDNYISLNLGDPELNPARIAAAVRISVRYLHRLFGSRGRSVTDYIRDLRLEGCHAALSQGRSESTLSSLAYRWGFADQAHFCRLFKSRYGVTPRDIRQAATHSRVLATSRLSGLVSLDPPSALPDKS